jgi:hypothetical protein
VLAKTTSRNERVVLIDPADAFDVASAQARGICVKHLLWVRPPDVKSALRAAELILKAGGFGVVALDMEMKQENQWKPPMACWMRIARLASSSSALVLVLTSQQKSEMDSISSLVVEVGKHQARWQGGRERWLEGIDLSFNVRKMRKAAIQNK